MKIRCKMCGKELNFLATHLRKAHGVSVKEYREAYDIPQGEPLASDEYRSAHRNKMVKMQADGVLTYDHLEQAVEKSRAAKSRPKRGAAREKQRSVLNETRPWEKKQLPPGSKRVDGRDADSAREYQREYRKRKKMPNHPNRSRVEKSNSANPNPSMEEVRSAREAAGLTQSAAAAMVHTTCRNWQQWEAGDRRMHPGLWELFKIKLSIYKSS